MLGDGNREALEDGADVRTHAVLVASPDQKRAARKIRADRAASDAMAAEDEPAAVAVAGPPKAGEAGEVPPVPIFHCGPLAWREAEGEPPSTLWPLFFRLDDIETMWRQVGG
jgi:hypothetical protein